jgi:hypothetical protein
MSRLSRHERVARTDNAVQDIFRPEGPILSAQAEGLGIDQATENSALKGPFAVGSTLLNDPLRVALRLA